MLVAGWWRVGGMMIVPLKYYYFGRTRIRHPTVSRRNQLDCRYGNFFIYYSRRRTNVCLQCICTHSDATFKGTIYRNWVRISKKIISNRTALNNGHVGTGLKCSTVNGFWTPICMWKLGTTCWSLILWKEKKYPCWQVTSHFAISWDELRSRKRSRSRIGRDQVIGSIPHRHHYSNTLRFDELTSRVDSILTDSLRGKYKVRVTLLAYT